MTYYVDTILQGSALDKLKELPDEYVDCIITSPPYWSLRDYKTEPPIWDSDPNCDHEFKIISKDINLVTGKNSVSKRPWRKNASGTISTGKCSKCNAWKGELGQEQTIDLYIRHLISIFNECKRVLKKEGTCWVVIGDTYSRNSDSNVPDSWTKGYKCHERWAKKTVNATKSGILEKSLCMIPERFAIAMIDKGWILRNKIIWHKRNCMPSSAKDRFTVDYEYIYFFVKSQKYYFKTQYQPHSRDWTNDIPHWHNGTAKHLAIQNPQSNFANPPNPLGRIKRCVWTINTKPFSEAHFAVFPEELVKQCLDAGCPENGIILDMFLGSGTTALVALKNNRRFVGIELNKDYVSMATKRIDPYLKQQKLI